jgi:hypothetical protein
MNARKEYVHGLLGFLVAGAIFASYELGRARADGIPATPTMYYGVSLEENGAPVTGTRDVAVRFFGVETGGTRLCETLANGTTVSQGRARIALDETCRNAVRDNQNVWVELAVGGNVVGARSRIGAVPYAVEAARADGLTAAAQVSEVNRACPPEYTVDMSASPAVVCFKDWSLGTATVRDEIVRVGVGATAFWVDRYEASAFRVGDGMQLSAVTSTGSNTGTTVEAGGIEVNGYASSATLPAMALSREGFPTTNVSWFQANELCNAAGKRLINQREWFAAVRGTPPDTSVCITNQSGPRAAARANACRSLAGVHDMIGNVWEWTAEWFAGVGGATTTVNLPTSTSPWPATTGNAGFNDDRTWNINGVASNGSVFAIGLPAAALRGGSFEVGSQGGAFALALADGPSARLRYVGFRCVRPH